MGDVLDNGDIALEFYQFVATCVTHDPSVQQQPTVVAKTNGQLPLKVSASR